MRTTTIVASFIRSASMLGLLAGFLFASSPALAAEAPTAAAKKTFTDELAERVEAKANFAASVAPRLAGAESTFRYSSQYPKPMIIAWLWALRSNPALQQEWLDTITAPVARDKERDRALYDLSEFMNKAEDIARDLQSTETGNLWRLFRAKLFRSVHTNGPSRSVQAETAGNLAEAKAWDKTFADALVLVGVYKQAGISSSEGREYSGILLKLRNRPEDLALAASLLGNQDISRDRLGPLLHTLASAPEAARKEAADLENILEAEKKYFFASRLEGEFSFTLLPLASILPDAVKPVEKPGTIPLAASPVKGPEKTLSITRLEQLMPEDFPLRDKDGNKNPLPFLLPGERLYAVGREHGTPIFANTPLEVLAPSGPTVAELIPGTDESPETFFEDMRQREPSLFLVAAACGPEELAAHLAGLSVMAAARESSLYGPYEDFLWSSEKNDLEQYGFRKNLPREFPADLPGETARLVQVQSKLLFLALAPIADKEGLTRLMGPVRGVWARTGGWCAPQPWVALRYAPKAGKTKAFALGSAPLLKLGKPALEALNAGLEQYVASTWVNYEQRELIETDMNLCREQFPAALADMEAEFATLRAKRFVSPLDVSAALYLLKEHGKDTTMLEKLRAVLDDTSRSSAKRVLEMEKIGSGEKND